RGRDRALQGAARRRHDAPHRHSRGARVARGDAGAGAQERRAGSGRRAAFDGDAMRTVKLLRLARGNIVRELPALVLSAGGVALGVGCLVFFLALGAGLRRVVNDVFPVSTREVEVVVPSLAIGNLLGEQKIDEETVEKLRKISGVSAAYPKMQLRIPAV